MLAHAMVRAPTFTVFTPTYNRAEKLSRPYEGLTAQTFRDFEWLIVDDGSTDRTRELVERWREEADFPIRYLHQENRGKHVAHNRGVREARGMLFLVLDSDDGCVPHALERFHHHWMSIPPDRREGFSAVTANACDTSGRLLGDPFPRSPLDSDPVELRRRYRVEGEKWGFHLTSVLGEFPFPEPGELKFVPEAVVWNAIAQRYKTRYVNETLRVYDVDYGEDNLTVAFSDPEASASAWWVLKRQELDSGLRHFRHDPAHYLRAAASYGRFSKHRRLGLVARLRALSTWRARALALAATPAGMLLYRRDRHAARRQPHSDAGP